MNAALPKPNSNEQNCQISVVEMDQCRPSSLCSKEDQLEPVAQDHAQSGFEPCITMETPHSWNNLLWECSTTLNIIFYLFKQNFMYLALHLHHCAGDAIPNTAQDTFFAVSVHRWLKLNLFSLQITMEINGRY